MYPNPTGQAAWLQWSEKARPQRIRVVDLSGRAVFNYKPEDTSEYRMSINTGHWPNGVYFVEVTLPEGKIFKQKLVVQH
jgi:hypothetical protein